MVAAIEPLARSGRLPPLAIDYACVDAATLLAQPDVLAIIGFAERPDSPSAIDARLLTVPLAHVGDGSRLLEYWRVDGPVCSGRDGGFVWAHGGGYLFVALTVNEDAHGGIRTAAAHAYRRLLDTLRSLDHPHPLRIWNYLADINHGEGDHERYRQFTIGRAEGIDALDCASFPAATAIGRRDGVREILVYALASKTPGQPVENPRQVSAYRYPRQYGPVSPSFARAMRVDTPAAPLLLISGTASVVGHLSLHDQPELQAAETLRNIESLLQTAGSGPRSHLSSDPRLKAYVRDPAHADVVRRTLSAAGLPPEHLIVLHGDICRSELLLEIDGVIRL
jgi:chorismate lyase/3-hydroxybenzoate synthase